MTDDTIVAEFRRSRRETVRVSLASFHGNPIVSVRAFFETGDGQPRPGRDGIALSVRHLPALADAFAKAVAEAKARGLVE